jgi:endo-1,4-beta-xylanase
MSASFRVVTGALALLLPLGIAGSAFGQDRAGATPATAATAKSLRQAAGDRLLLGTAILSEHLDDPRHAELIRTQFNSVTPGNEMKPDHVQNERGKFTFERADKIVAFAQQNGMQVIGHTLVWHSQSPKWLYADAQGKPLPREQALANMKEHIEAVVKHYKGKVKGWDVVNEGIPDGPGDLRDTPARRAIGDDYIIKAFEFARAADPDVELYYNDYNIDMDYKRARGLKLVKQLQAAGVRLDGVGIQGHWLLEKPDLAEIERGIKAYADLGLNVMITEMDVDPLPRKEITAELSATEREGLDPYKAGLPDDVQRKLADRYAALFGVFAKYPQVTRVTIWGTTDANTWLNNFPVRGRTNHPMLWDRQMNPKPAFDAVYEALQSATGPGKRAARGTPAERQ